MVNQPGRSRGTTAADRAREVAQRAHEADMQMRVALATYERERVTSPPIMAMPQHATPIALSGNLQADYGQLRARIAATNPAAVGLGIGNTQTQYMKAEAAQRIYHQAVNQRLGLNFQDAMQVNRSFSERLHENARQISPLAMVGAFASGNPGVFVQQMGVAMARAVGQMSVGQIPHFARMQERANATADRITRGLPVTAGDVAHLDRVNSMQGLLSNSIQGAILRNMTDNNARMFGAFGRTFEGWRTTGDALARGATTLFGGGGGGAGGIISRLAGFGLGDAGRIGGAAAGLLGASPFVGLGIAGAGLAGAMALNQQSADFTKSEYSLQAVAGDINGANIPGGVATGPGRSDLRGLAKTVFNVGHEFYMSQETAQTSASQLLMSGVKTPRMNEALGMSSSLAQITGADPRVAASLVGGMLGPTSNMSAKELERSFGAIFTAFRTGQVPMAKMVESIQSFAQASGGFALTAKGVESLAALQKQVGGEVGQNANVGQVLGRQAGMTGFQAIGQAAMLGMTQDQFSAAQRDPAKLMAASAKFLQDSMKRMTANGLDKGAAVQMGIGLAQQTGMFDLSGFNATQQQKFIAGVMSGKYQSVDQFRKDNAGAPSEAAIRGNANRGNEAGQSWLGKAWSNLGGEAGRLVQGPDAIGTIGKDVSGSIMSTLLGTDANDHTQRSAWYGMFSNDPKQRPKDMWDGILRVLTQSPTMGGGGGGAVAGSSNQFLNDNVGQTHTVHVVVSDGKGQTLTRQQLKIPPRPRAGAGNTHLPMAKVQDHSSSNPFGGF